PSPRCACAGPVVGLPPTRRLTTPPVPWLRPSPPPTPPAPAARPHRPGILTLTTRTGRTPASPGKLRRRPLLPIAKRTRPPTLALLAPPTPSPSATLGAD